MEQSSPPCLRPSAIHWASNFFCLVDNSYLCLDAYSTLAEAMPPLKRHHVPETVDPREITQQSIES